MTVPLRAALYLRVSTARQAEHDVSIPDQRKQGEAYCLSRGLELVDTFVEAGASATNDRRPEFQRMIEAGTSKPAPFDVVVVHSFSRFFRDHFELEFYVRKLAKNGVKLLSITQEMGDDPMHVMMRQIMALFDEYQSKENAKHVLRALKENARQGFWNGSLPPIGYRVVDAEQRGAKMKKKLEIDPIHADTVRLAFKLALEGDGTSGPMGVKSITKHLNERRIFTRDGGRWGIGTVHRMLTRPTYIGRHEFNKRGKSKELKPAEEVIAVEVPAIIDQATFDAVQAHFKARNPKVAHPQVVGGPTLLTGLIHCGKCGGAMTIRTGKGGRYRYYTCSMKARQGATACEGMTVSMERLDDLVANYLADRLLDPDRLEDVLAEVLDRRQERSDRRREHIAELNRRSAETELRLKRLYDAIESGVADLDDPALKDRIVALKATRDQARADAERASALLLNSTQQAITPATLRKFASTARRRIRTEGGGYRRDHLRALAQRVEVDRGEVRIMGSKSNLLRVLAANGVATAAGGVPIVVPKWRRGCLLPYVPRRSEPVRNDVLVQWLREIVVPTRTKLFPLIPKIFVGLYVGRMTGSKPTGRHQEKRLSAASVRNAKEPGFYGDGHGLYLKVDASGAKRWVQRLVIQGKRRDLGLGSASLVTLAEARERAVEQRKLARAGGDPDAAKKRSTAILTFQAAAERVHALQAPTWRNAKHGQQWLNTLQTFVHPHFGSKRIDAVTSADVMSALTPIWNERPETARRVKQRIGTVMKWAIAQGWRTDNPADTITKALPKHDRSKVIHRKALPYGDVAAAIAKVRASEAGMVTKLAFEFLVLTATRSVETREAVWSEFDLVKAVWTIPANRMKAKKVHRVPLSDRCLAILQEAEALRQQGSDLVFPGTKAGRPLSDMTLSKLMKELGIDAVPHGFRSSFRDWAGEATSHPREVVEFALAHVIKDKAEAAYARSDLFDKRRLLMAEWSTYLT